MKDIISPLRRKLLRRVLLAVRNQTALEHGLEYIQQQAELTWIQCIRGPGGAKWHQERIEHNIHTVRYSSERF
jgi:hypothetical protein